MDSEQRHHNRSSNSTTGGGGELFICFTSRLSSSPSMKISSKSILSPGRSREPTQISLSSSLSRRLRSNGSMKGGQASPMFPTAGKKKGCAFENPEPSSPKVTCIGQVRVKTKKQGKKMRSRSKRRGEVSFRRVEQSSAADGTTPQNDVVGQISRSYSQSHFNQQQEVLSQRNQRWVHLPMTICEALRAFGSDFNCFLPCRSSCMSSGEKPEKTADSAAGENNGSGCGAVFARWLVALQEGEGKGREIELVVGEEEEETEKAPEQGRSRSTRRHVFEDIDIGLERFEEEKPSKVNEEEEEPNRVSICVPPKNALLLMRCRSDPVKMAALANRFWESPPQKEEEDDKEEEEQEEEERSEEYQEAREETTATTVQLETEHSIEEPETEHCKDEGPEPEEDTEQSKDEGLEPEEKSVLVEAAISEEKVIDLVTEEQKLPEPESEETETNAAIEDCNRETEVFTEEPEPASEAATVLTESSPSEDLTSIAEQEIENIAVNLAPEEEEGDDVEEKLATAPNSPSASVHSEPEAETESDPESEDGEEDDEETPETEAEVSAVMAESVAETEEEMESREEEEEEETVTCVRPVPEDPTTTREPEPGRKSNDSVSRLPDCLLLMMCEPKLSMEVSKETWVCSTDFIRWLPERPPPVNKQPAKTNLPDEPKSRTSTDSNPAPPHRIKPSRRRPNPLHQPPRSSCSLPAPTQNPLAAGKAQPFEPFVLTRCKSEPVRSGSKLAQEGCFWNNRKIEPHRPGIGATGVGC